MAIPQEDSVRNNIPQFEIQLLGMTILSSAGENDALNIGDIYLL